MQFYLLKPFTKTAWWDCRDLFDVTVVVVKAENTQETIDMTFMFVSTKDK